MSEIIKDYGQTVTPKAYISALQGHQYIPQSDQCIRYLIHDHRLEINEFSLDIIDVGCGPGRLTQDIAFEHYGTRVKGVDISRNFIRYAEKKYSESGNKGINLEYICQDFCVSDSRFIDTKYDIIFLQGVMHHIHGDDRGLFKMRCLSLLKNTGILIIGDEFIKDYRDDEERKEHVCAFYCHIIAEALKGGFQILAEEEAKNLIDDVLSGEKGAGYMDEALKNYIFDRAQTINDSFYTGHHPAMDHEIRRLIAQVQREALRLAVKEESENFNRGDLKVSTKKFIEEFQYEGFKMKEIFRFGPVEELGGMANVVFTK